MKVKNILKGIGKLVLATSLMCGIGLFLCQDVKADDGKVDNVTASSGGITYDVIAPGTGEKAVTAIKISIDTSPETVISEITTVSPGTGFSVTKEDVFGKLNSGNIFSGQKNFVVKYTLEGDVTPYNNTATCSAKTNQIYKVTAATSGSGGTAKVSNVSGSIIDSGVAYGYAGAKVSLWIDSLTGVLKNWTNDKSLPSKTDKTFDYEINSTDANITWTANIVAAAESIKLDTKTSGSKITITGSKSLPVVVTGGAWTVNDIDWTYSASMSAGSVNNVERSGSNLDVVVSDDALGTITVTGTIPKSTPSGDLVQTFYIVIAKPLTNATINGLTSGSGKGYLNTAFSVAGAVNPGASATYKWTVSGPGGSFGNDTLQSTSYTPTATGTHTITLTATDTLDGTTTKTATYVLTVDTRATKLTLDLQNPEVTVGYKNIVVAKVTEGSLNGFSASDFKLTSTDTDKVSFDSTPTISADGSTLSFVIKGEKASTDAKISISGPSGVTLTVSNNTVKVYDLGTVEYNSSSRTLSVKMPDKVITGPNLKNNLKEVTGFKLKAYHGSEEIASLEKSGKNTSVTASELENIVTNNASKFTGETDSIWFKIIPYGTNTSGDKSEAKDKDDKVISKNTDGIAVYRVQVSGENIQTTTTYGLQGQQVKVTATPNPGCSFDKWSDGSTTPTKTVTVSSTTANNNLTAKGVLGERTPGANGGANSGDTSGLDRVPKTAESNAPIWLIIVLVFAAMGGGYALYLQMRPVKEDNKSNK